MLPFSRYSRSNGQNSGPKFRILGFPAGYRAPKSLGRISVRYRYVPSCNISRRRCQLHQPADTVRASVTTNVARVGSTARYSSPLATRRGLCQFLYVFSIRPLSFIFPRDAMHKRGLCRHALSVCASVCLVCHIRGFCQNE